MAASPTRPRLDLKLHLYGLGFRVRGFGLFGARLVKSGISRDCGEAPSSNYLYSDTGLYRDNGNENGDYYLGLNVTCKQRAKNAQALNSRPDAQTGLQVQGSGLLPSHNLAA